MLKQFFLDIKLHNKRFLLPLFMIPACFLLGFGLCCLIMFTEADPGSWVTFGTFMAWLSLFFLAVMSFGMYYQQFMLALSMGCTRKDFLFSFALRTLLELAMGCVLILVLYRVELAIGSKLFAPWPLEPGFEIMTDWRMIAICLPAMVLVTMFVGALYSYFGKKVLTVLWFLWIAFGLIVPRLVEREGNANVVVSFLRLIPDWGWIAAGVAAALAMAVTVVGLGKKQMVK